MDEGSKSRLRGSSPIVDTGWLRRTDLNEIELQPLTLEPLSGLKPLEPRPYLRPTDAAYAERSLLRRMVERLLGLD